MKNILYFYKKKLIISLLVFFLFLSSIWIYQINDTLEYFLYVAVFQIFVISLICYLFKIKIFYNAALILFSSIFSIALMETSFRLLHELNLPKKHAYWDENSDYPFSKQKVPYYQTSWLGAQAQPGQYKAHKKHPDKTTIYDVNYYIGFDRFRITPENEINKPKKINFFGGSLVFGEGVDSNETLPSYFKSLNKNFSVKNYGSHMFGVHEALAILESNLDTTGNINFLLTAPWHSLRLICVRGQSAANKPTFELDDKSIVKRKGTCRDFENSPLKVLPTPNKFIIAIQNSFISKKVGYVVKDKSLNEEIINLYIAIIKKMKKISENRGQEFVIGFIKANGLDYRSFNNELIISRLLASGINLIDMSLLNEEGISPDKYVIDPKFERHSSAIANYERASILTSYLQKLRLINIEKN